MEEKEIIMNENSRSKECMIVFDIFYNINLND